MRRVGSGRHYICSVCGKPGHNKRSCGNTPRIVVAPPALNRVEVQEETSTGSAMSWDSMAEGIPEYATTDEGTNSSSPENDSSESPGEETLNVNELETWWMLSGEGRRGKHAQRGLDYELWSDRDTESLSSIVSTLPDNEETYETVKLFMKSFGSVAKNNLARYEGTPPHILAVLAEDQSVKTRQAVAAWQNNLTHKIMSILAHDTNGTVRRALADNPVIPADILETLHGTRFLSDDKSKRVESDAEYIEKILPGTRTVPPTCSSTILIRVAYMSFQVLSPTRTSHRQSWKKF